MDNTLIKQVEHFKNSSRKEIIDAAKALADGSAEALKGIISRVGKSKVVACISNAVQSAPAKAADFKRYITSTVHPKFVPMLTEIYVLAVGVGLLLTGAMLLEVIGVVLILWALCMLLPTIIEVAQEKILGLMKSAL